MPRRMETRTAIGCLAVVSVPGSSEHTISICRPPRSARDAVAFGSPPNVTASGDLACGLDIGLYFARVEMSPTRQRGFRIGALLYELLASPRFGSLAGASGSDVSISAATSINTPRVGEASAKEPSHV